MATTEQISSTLEEASREIAWVASELQERSADGYDELESELGERISQIQQAQDQLAELRYAAEEDEDE